MYRKPDKDETGLLIQHTQYPTAHVIVLRGATGPAAGHQLDAAFRRAAASGLPLIVDLAALDFADEELLSHLLHAHQTSGLQLVGPLAGPVQRRFHVTGAATLFTLLPNLAAGLTP
ncbi:anti-sigma factor antagonist [Streptomyces sp. ZEA17I]|uniref:anti-sigma factor antagonist n=1 Tax=Streptomyces sp. ZEA17I TaxID=2202516 RepID=UPI000D6EF3F7|nr:anti-sigma factor antagonist [Streptomyces sp. ZEA17I]PWS48026.1 anti-sigma factor antagonist [Streptomyces sp. ZEA17I]